MKLFALLLSCFLSFGTNENNQFTSHQQANTPCIELLNRETLLETDPKYYSYLLCEQEEKIAQLEDEINDAHEETQTQKTYTKIAITGLGAVTVVALFLRKDLLSKAKDIEDLKKLIASEKQQIKQKEIHNDYLQKQLTISKQENIDLQKKITTFLKDTHEYKRMMMNLKKIGFGNFDLSKSNDIMKFINIAKKEDALIKARSKKIDNLFKEYGNKWFSTTNKESNHREIQSKVKEYDEAIEKKFSYLSKITKDMMTLLMPLYNIKCIDEEMDQSAFLEFYNEFSENAATYFEVQKRKVLVYQSKWTWKNDDISQQSQ